jgi:hypothetical protein
MALQKRVMLDLNAKVKVTEASEKDTLAMKQIEGKFKMGKTRVYILKSKYDIKRGWLTGNSTMKRK